MKATEPTTPVRVRIGDRREYVVGYLLADAHGRVHLDQLADLFATVSEHMQVIADHAAQAHRDSEKDD